MKQGQNVLHLKRLRINNNDVIWYWHVDRQRDRPTDWLSRGASSTKNLPLGISFFSGPSYWTSTNITPSDSSVIYFNTSLLQTESFIVKVKSQSKSYTANFEKEKLQKHSPLHFNLDESCLCTLISIQHPACPLKTKHWRSHEVNKWVGRGNGSYILLHHKSWENFQKI